jgi:DNA-binding FadR family transcriptional regulator
MLSLLDRPDSIVDACERRLRNAILDGELAPGDRLPPERKLAETFGVNRVTVRSALTRLARQNLLSVRQGSGYVVRDFRRVGGPELLPGLVDLARDAGTTRAVVADLLFVRRHMARALLDRLALTIDAPSLAAIERAIDRFADAVARRTPLDELARGDLGVLEALLDATKSAVLGLWLNPIASVLGAMPELQRAMYAEPEGNVLGWRALAAWLAAPDRSTIDHVVAILEARDEATLARLGAMP